MARIPLFAHASIQRQASQQWYAVLRRHPLSAALAKHVFGMAAVRADMHRHVLHQAEHRSPKYSIFSRSSPQWRARFRHPKPACMTTLPRSPPHRQEERLRLARELHDDTIQVLIALRQRVQLARKASGETKAAAVLEELESLTEATIENVRRMTRALRPIYLEDLGLMTALEMLTRETNQVEGLQVDFQRSGQERRLSREAELALYRIAQQALGNVARHAGAQRAILRLDFSEAAVSLEVTDDGIGFQIPRYPTDLAPSGHFGLLGIHERADLIGARMEIHSELGRGARISVRLPTVNPVRTPRANSRI